LVVRVIALAPLDWLAHVISSPMVKTEETVFVPRGRICVDFQLKFFDLRVGTVPIVADFGLKRDLAGVPSIWPANRG
jgi:hypothetical protein